MVQLNDLTAVGTVAKDSVLLFVKNEDSKKENAECVQYVLGSDEFYLGTTEKFAKFTPFMDVDVEDVNKQSYYRNLVYRHMSDQKLLDSLQALSKDGDE